MLVAKLPVQEDAELSAPDPGTCKPENWERVLPVTGR